MHRHPITQEGFASMQSELSDLEATLKTAILELTRTRELGDLSENSAYRLAKSAVRRLESRIRYLKKIIDHATILQPPSKNSVGLGNTVKIREGMQYETYIIVDSVEADILKGKLSLHAPLGKALLGAKKGHIVVYHTPSGKREVEIISIA